MYWLRYITRPDMHMVTGSTFPKGLFAANAAVAVRPV